MESYRVPPIVRGRVPIDIERFEALANGVYRLRFATLADDGYPTIFDEEVTPEGNVDDWLIAFLNDHQTTRARLNREAAAKALEDQQREVTYREGPEDSTAVSAIDALFPTNTGRQVEHDRQ